MGKAALFLLLVFLFAGALRALRIWAANRTGGRP
jgi:hypothetical protein